MKIMKDCMHCGAKNLVLKMKIGNYKDNNYIYRCIKCGQENHYQDE